MGVQLDEGGTYQPNKVQLALWRMWDMFWEEFVPEATKGEPYGVLFNGDALDGVHHKSVTQYTHNLTTQQKIAESILRPVTRKAEVYYHIRGTEAHVGSSAMYEEGLAVQLDAKPNEEGQYARPELWIQIGRALVHAMHHIGTTSSQAYEATAVHKELVESFTEASRWGERPPDIIVRSHRHRFLETKIATDNTHAIAVVTPGWQGKTPFVYKIAGGRLSQPQWGGVVIRFAHNEFFIRDKVWSPPRGKVETP
jgi:hypothetical protein